MGRVKDKLVERVCQTKENTFKFAKKTSRYVADLVRYLCLQIVNLCLQ